VANLADKVPTGVEGLDELLKGGFPKGSVILVCGGPGSGKTILGIQFLVKGARDCNQPGLYLSLEESKTHVCAEMLNFGWNLDKLEKARQLLVLDMSPIRVLPSEMKFGELVIGRKEFTAASLIDAIKSHVKTIKAERIVIDPITILSIQYREPYERRNVILQLFQGLVELGATTLVTSEVRTNSPWRRLHLEEYISQGVLLLESVRSGQTLVKTVHIEKMRGTDHDHQPRLYEITPKGIEVHPQEIVFG
jgi:circadian clock protein KaiC